MKTVFILQHTYRQMTTQSYQFNNLYVLCSLNERAIYIKIVDKFTNTCYENNTDPKEIRGLPGTIQDIYKLIIKCFDEKNVKFSANNGVMTCHFTSCLEGFFTLNFDILLREKILGQDGEVSIQIFGLEQQLRDSQEYVRKLEERIERREKEMKKELEDLKHIQHLHLLKTMGLGMDYDFKQEKGLSYDGHYQSHSLLPYTKITISDYTPTRGWFKYGYQELESVKINNSSSQVFDNNELLDLAKKPKLKHIAISNCNNSLTMTGLQQFFEKMECKLESLTINACNQLTDKIAIKKLCDKRGIELNM